MNAHFETETENDDSSFDVMRSSIKGVVKWYAMSTRGGREEKNRNKRQRNIIDNAMLEGLERRMNSSSFSIVSFRCFIISKMALLIGCAFEPPHARYLVLGSK